jgi:hypothetical protein
MAKFIYTHKPVYVKENTAPVLDITYNMLTAMIEALDNRDYIRNPANFAERRAKTEKILRAEQPALPLEYMEYDSDLPIPEHRAIMVPDFTHLEGSFAVSEHLGETKPAKIFKDRRGVAYMKDGEGISNLDKIIYYEAGMTAQGDAVLPHEDHSRRAWYKDAAQIKSKFSLTIEQAETLALAFKILDTTPKMAKKFDKWLSTPDKFNAGFRYFENLASQMVLVTDEGEPTIIDIAQELEEDTNTIKTVDADNPADIQTIQAEGWHKLDDPRDEAPLWEDRQGKDFKKVLTDIRKAALPELKAIGKSLFNDKRFNKIQTSVIWDEYRRRKHNLEPKLRRIAIVALERLADKKCNLNIVANWLHGEGKALLNAHEQSVIWAAWKKYKGAYAPKREESPMPEQANFDYSTEEYEEMTYTLQ